MTMKKIHRMEIRVRYSETDAMGFLHHANYFNYFEMGRTEMLRDSGGSYREMEQQGFFLVVAKIECRYKAPARYDDLLDLETELTDRTQVKLHHEYRIIREGACITTGSSVLACVDAKGKPTPIPEAFIL